MLSFSIVHLHNLVPLVIPSILRGVVGTYHVLGVSYLVSQRFYVSMRMKSVQ